MTAADFAARIEGAKRRAGGQWWDARCPSHDDRRSSLSFSDGDRGLVLECHAGCAVEKITAALGLSVKQLFHANGNGNGHSNGHHKAERQIRATYDYHDEGGTLLYQVVRFEPKDFRQRRP